MSAPGDAAPWYANGLRFACARCGNCCAGDPGHVWVSPDECREAAAHLGLTLRDFTKRHVRRVGTRLSLLEQRNGDCEHLIREEPGPTACAIHPVRPIQCRTWPFWASNLESPDAWEHASRECPGIGKGAPHGLPIILAALQANGDLPL